ncbi:MAG: DotU family type IV/VI secretion system protein [Desulfovibrionaceae bacterium]
MRLMDCFAGFFAYVGYLVKDPLMASASYETVRQDVERLVGEAMACCERRETPKGHAENAKFAICAWADEAILTSKWPGRNEWLKQPLQREHFDTSNAGEEFFQRLGELTPDEEVEVLEVFAACLAMGFVGEFFRVREPAKLQEVRRKSVELAVGGRGPSVTEALFPFAYGSRERAGAGRKLWKRFDPWALVFFVLPLVICGTIFYVYEHHLDVYLKGWLGLP